MTDRLTKNGWCKQCSRSDIEVSWHPGSRAFYCTDCWPKLPSKEETVASEQDSKNRKAAAEFYERWNAGVERNYGRDAREAERLRDQLYGIRIEDDPVHEASFLAVCPEHGTLGTDLMLTAARVLRDEHMIQHGIAGSKPHPAESAVAQELFEDTARTS